MGQNGNYSTDALTGLGHRRAFATVLERGGAGTGVLLAKLRCLEAVDKAVGYRAGDEYLTLAAELVKKLLPGQGTAYRAEGNCFALLLPGADGKALAALEEALLRDFDEACPPWLRELGGELAVSWAESAGALKDTLGLAEARLMMGRAGR